MWHTPSFNRTTKDDDWHFINTFATMPQSEKMRFIQLSGQLLKQQIQAISNQTAS